MKIKSTQVSTIIFIFSLIGIFSVAFGFPLNSANAQASNAGSGMVPPGNACKTDTDCADPNGQLYGCYPEGNGICTVDGDPPADGTVPPGGACTNDNSCQDTATQTYGCYNGLCTLNGDAQATPATTATPAAATPAANTTAPIPLDGSVGLNGSCTANANACGVTPNDTDLTCINGTCQIGAEDVNSGDGTNALGPGASCTITGTTDPCGEDTYGDDLTCINGTCQVGAEDANPTTATPAATTNTANTSSAGLLQNPLQAPDLATLLVEILGYVTKIGTIFLVLMLMWVGFQFVMAQGAPEAVSKARSALLWTAVGGLLLLGAQAIAIVIVSTVAGL